MLVLSKSYLLDILKSLQICLSSNKKDVGYNHCAIIKNKDKTVFYSTDRFCSMIVTFDLKLEEGFNFKLLDLREFVSYISNIKSNDIYLSIENESLLIESEDKDTQIRLDLFPFESSGFPSIPEFSNLELQHSFSRESFTNCLLFTSNYIKDKSSNSMETILDFKNNRVLGGATSFISFYENEDLNYDFYMRSIVVKKLSSILKKGSYLTSEEVTVKSNLFITVTALDKNVLFVNLNNNSKVKRFIDISKIIDSFTPTVSFILGKTSIINCLKLFKTSSQPYATFQIDGELNLALIYHSKNNKESLVKLEDTQVSLGKGGDKITVNIETFLKLITPFPSDVSINFNYSRKNNILYVSSQSAKETYNCVLSLGR